MRVVIADDEPLARRGIRARLRALQDIEVVGEADDGVSAVHCILTLKPDLVFLDVHMPRMDGFEVVQAIPAEELPYTIFLTAFDQYAVRAFEVNAVDYLVKPPDQRRFDAAIQRVQKLWATAQRAKEAERLHRLAGASSGAYLRRTAIRTGTRIELVDISEIQWFGSAGDYVELHGAGRTWLLRESMNALERRLDPSDFIRIHRTRIVRRAAISELRSLDNREYVVKLRDGTRHRSSRTYSEALTAWIGVRRQP